MKFQKIKINTETKTTFEKKKIENLFFNVKDFLFISISVKCIFWQIKNKNVESHVFYRNQDDF